MSFQENTEGFYKANLGKTGLHYAPNRVHTCDDTLYWELKDNYNYPHDGWTWYDSREQALAAEGVTEPEEVKASRKGARPRRNTTDA